MRWGTTPELKNIVPVFLHREKYMLPQFPNQKFDAVYEGRQHRTGA